MRGSGFPFLLVLLLLFRCSSSSRFMLFSHGCRFRLIHSNPIPQIESEGDVDAAEFARLLKQGRKQAKQKQRQQGDQSGTGGKRRRSSTTTTTEEDEGDLTVAGTAGTAGRAGKAAKRNAPGVDGSPASAAASGEDTEESTSESATEESSSSEEAETKEGEEKEREKQEKDQGEKPKHTPEDDPSDEDDGGGCDLNDPFGTLEFSFYFSFCIVLDWIGSLCSAAAVVARI